MLGDVNMDLMKGTNYTLYNALIMLELDQLISEVTRLESKSCMRGLGIFNTRCE